jgi:hypothetical protein
VYTKQSLIEQLELQSFCNVIDTQTGSNDATTGDWLRMTGERALVVFLKEAGTAGDDPTITLAQATSNSGGSSKALNFGTIYRKESTTSIQSVGTWTKTTQSAASTYTNDTSAESYLCWAIEIKADDLDADGGFKYIRATVADTGSASAQLGVLFVIMGSLRYGGAATIHEDTTA